MTPLLERTIASSQACCHGWSPKQKCVQMAEWIIAEKPELVVELGIFGGRSLIPMALAIKENKSGVAWGIDPWTKEAATENSQGEDCDWWSKIDLESVYRSFLLNIIRYDLLLECRWIRARAEDAVKIFADHSVGLLHVDSNHSEIVSCRQVALWQRKIKPGGILVMDDVHWESQRRAIGMIKEFADEIGQWEVEGQHWAAYRVKLVAPTEVRVKRKYTKKVKHRNYA